MRVQDAGDSADNVSVPAEGEDRSIWDLNP